MGTFNIKELASLGLPAGQYIVYLDSIEAGMSAATPPQPKLTFTARLAQASGSLAPGRKHVWSYTMQTQYLGIVARSLLKAGIEGDAPDNAAQLAQWLHPQMVNRYFEIVVAPQRKDPSMMNTEIVGPYGGGAGGAVAAAPAPVPTPAPVAAVLPPATTVAAAPPPAGYTPAPAQVAPAPAPVPVAAPAPVAAPPPPAVAPPPAPAPAPQAATVAPPQTFAAFDAV